MPVLTQLDVRQAHLEMGGTRERKLAFLQSTPVFPPDDGPLPTTALREKAASVVQTDNNGRFSKLKIEDLPYRIAFIKFAPVVRDNVGALTFDVKYAEELTTTASRAGYIPIWYLPWKSGHMVKIKIEAHNSVNPSFANPGPGLDSLPNPNVFFTAAIAGCSVFVRGTVQEPRVYHGGISTDLVSLFTPQEWADMGGSSESFWLNFLDGVTAAGGRLTRKPGVVKSQGVLGEVNRSHYVAERKPDGSHVLNPANSKTTFNALEYEKFIRKEVKGVLNIKEVSPWGAVFGVRDSLGNWEFYLVENATITYGKIVKERKGLRTKKREVVDNMPGLRKEEKFLSPAEVIRQRPTDVRDAHGATVMQPGPMGAAAQPLTYTYQSLPFSQCVNLGHRKFYPGGTQAVVNTPTGIHFSTS